MVALILSTKGQVAVKDQILKSQQLEIVGMKQWTKHLMTKDSYNGLVAIKRNILLFQCIHFDILLLQMPLGHFCFIQGNMKIHINSQWRWNCM